MERHNPNDSYESVLSSVTVPVSPAETEHGADCAAEQLLLRKISQGDTSAFWKLWEQSRDSLYRRCLLWMGGNREDAEDALSSAALKALHRLPRHASEINNPKAWLVRLTHNLCVDLQRERKRHTRYVKNARDMQEITGQEEELMLKRPEDATLQHELLGHLGSTIARLPPQLRVPSLLRFVQEWPYQDIAEYLTLSPENARKRIQQARAALQGQLQAYLSGKTAPLGEEVKDDKAWGMTCSLKRKDMEIHREVRVMRLVQLRLPSGIEHRVYLFLDQKPSRSQRRVKTLRAYVARHPRGWRKRLALADLLYAIGEWEAAMEEYRRVLERQPRLVNVWLRLGSMLSVLERQAEAIAVYRQSVAWVRTNATQRHVAGLIAMCQHCPEIARQAFTQATLLEPENGAHWHALGIAHQQGNCPSEALCAFEAALQINPHDIVALTYRYEGLVAQGQRVEAQRCVAQLLALDPQHVLALTSSADQRSTEGLVFGEEGRKTRQLIQQALRLAPEIVEPQASLGLYYLVRGKKEAGLNVLRTFTERHPNCPRGWFYYAQGLLRCGEVSAATGAMRKAEALGPNDTLIARAKESILRRAPEEGGR